MTASHTSRLDPSLHRSVADRLREHDIRYTSGRRAVVEALAGTDGPRSAAELAEDLGPSVPLSSLYRTLAVLEEAGVATPHLWERGIARFELAEWLLGHHHHLICVDCGSVEDITPPDPLETQVEELIELLGSSAGFRPTSHDLEIAGVCRECA